MTDPQTLPDHINQLDDATEHAARIIGKHMSRWDMAGRPDVAGGIDVEIACALADSGLLSARKPNEPLTEEWRAYDQESGGEAPARTRAHAESLVGELSSDSADCGLCADWTVQRRYVTDWLPVDHADQKSEGVPCDGVADYSEGTGGKANGGHC